MKKLIICCIALVVSVSCAFSQSNYPPKHIQLTTIDTVCDAIKKQDLIYLSSNYSSKQSNLVSQYTFRNLVKNDFSTVTVADNSATVGQFASLSIDPNSYKLAFSPYAWSPQGQDLQDKKFTHVWSTNITTTLNNQSLLNLKDWRTVTGSISYTYIFDAIYRYSSGEAQQSEKEEAFTAKKNTFLIPYAYIHDNLKDEMRYLYLEAYEANKKQKSPIVIHGRDASNNPIDVYAYLNDRNNLNLTVTKAYADNATQKKQITVTGYQNVITKDPVIIKAFVDDKNNLVMYSKPGDDSADKNAVFIDGLTNGGPVTVKGYLDNNNDLNLLEPTAYIYDRDKEHPNELIQLNHPEYDNKQDFTQAYLDSVSKYEQLLTKDKWNVKRFGWLKMTVTPLSFDNAYYIRSDDATTFDSPTKKIQYTPSGTVSGNYFIGTKSGWNYYFNLNATLGVKDMFSGIYTAQTYVNFTPLDNVSDLQPTNEQVFEISGVPLTPKALPDLGAEYIIIKSFKRIALGADINYINNFVISNEPGVSIGHISTISLGLIIGLHDKNGKSNINIEPYWQNQDYLKVNLPSAQLWGVKFSLPINSLY